MLSGIARGLVCATALAVAAPVGAVPVGDATIALTFDDLPALTLIQQQAFVNDFNARLLHGLRRHHFAATGFVNEGKLDTLYRPRQIAILKAWLNAGMDLGNHTFSHVSPNSAGAQGYIADIVRGEPVTRALLARHHRALRWFRPPYLETGSPGAVKSTIDDWLTVHGYRTAPVTLNANDWEFADPYDRAVARHDALRQARIKSEYLAYTTKMIAWYRLDAHVLFGRDVAYIMLLHDTRLNADSLDGLAAILKQQHLRVVSLDRAMRDPAYQTQDSYSGPNGIQWMERWSITLHKDLPWTAYSDPPADILAELKRSEAGGSSPVS